VTLKEESVEVTWTSITERWWCLGEDDMKSGSREGYMCRVHNIDTGDSVKCIIMVWEGEKCNKDKTNCCCKYQIWNMNSSTVWH